jgi:hypothetical protein
MERDVRVAVLAAKASEPTQKEAKRDVVAASRPEAPEIYSPGPLLGSLSAPLCCSPLRLRGRTLDIRHRRLAYVFGRIRYVLLDGRLFSIGWGQAR